MRVVSFHPSLCVRYPLLHDPHGFVRFAWQRVSHPFRNSLPLERAQAYEAVHASKDGSPADHSTPAKPATSIFQTTALSGLALLQVPAWSGLGSYSFAVRAQIWDVALPIVAATTWLYASLRPIVWSSQTVFYDLFVLYLAHIVTGLIVLGASFFDHSVYQLPLPPPAVLAARVVNLSVLAILLAIVLNMLFAVLSPRIDKDDGRQERATRRLLFSPHHTSCSERSQNSPRSQLHSHLSASP